MICIGDVKCGRVRRIMSLVVSGEISLYMRSCRRMDHSRCGRSTRLLQGMYDESLGLQAVGQVSPRPLRAAQTRSVGLRGVEGGGRGGGRDAELLLVHAKVVVQHGQFLSSARGLVLGRVEAEIVADREGRNH